jgi:uncharacterized membrane protein
MPIVYKIIFLLTALLLALIAGLFYSYSCSVNPGLGKLTDMEYLRGMQSINRAILNPLFFASFMGTVIMMPLSTWLLYRYEGAGSSFYFILAATIVYIAGVFGVTVAGNVPLNNMLDKADLVSANVADIRRNFEIPWNRLNTIRTGSNILSLILLLVALIRK